MRSSIFDFLNTDDRRVVNMRLVRVCRRRHGTGGFVHEDPNEIRITPNWFYRGDFRIGKRHGQGVNSTYCSKYTGKYDQNVERDGSGTFKNNVFSFFQN